MTPAIGRIVHVNIGGADAPEWRPAIITRVWSDICVQATIFLDTFNDNVECYPALARDCISLVNGCHGRSLSEGEDALNWRWPPRV